MNEKTQKDVLANLQAKLDDLPAGTVLEPPTNDDDDSDVKDVEFGDPKLMKPKSVWYTAPRTDGSRPSPFEDYEEDLAQKEIDDATAAPTQTVKFVDDELNDLPRGATPRTPEEQATYDKWFYKWFAENVMFGGWIR
jgi:hypothetical protein